ncbi:MAG: hypothetical protein ACK4FS_09325, partial [Flavobacterium sp.]
FTSKELDLVITKLLECDQPLYDFQFQEKHLKDWQLLKVKAIFEYLVENHSDMFDYAEKSKEFGYSIEIGEFKSIWESELKKGGFTAFWKKKDDFKTSVKNILSGAKDTVSAIDSVIRLTDSFL